MVKYPERITNQDVSLRFKVSAEKGVRGWPRMNQHLAISDCVLVHSRVLHRSIHCVVTHFGDVISRLFCIFWF